MEIPAIKRSKERDFHFLLSLLLGEQYTAYSNWVMRTIMATPSRRATTLMEIITIECSMSHLHDALAEGGALKELWDHRHSRDVNEST